MGLVRYLTALKELKGSPLLAELKPVTHLQFQAQLYSLTPQGGPRYSSQHVRSAAFAALDALYPAGARTRKLISQLFKIFHPMDWPRSTATLISRSWHRCFALLLFILSWIVSLIKPFFK